jgi:putative spermidine/putrescine transport system permease protein
MKDEMENRMSGLFLSQIWSSDLGKRWGRHILLLGPLVAYLVVFFIYPLSGVFIKSVFDPEFTNKHFLVLIEHPVYMKVLWNTLEISIGITLIAVVFGYPVAYYLSSSKSNWGTILLIAILLPFWMSVLVRTYAWMIILGRYGAVNSFLMNTGLINGPVPLMYNRLGVYIGMVYVMFPYTILPMLSVMQGIDRTLMQASDNLGATPWQSFRHVFLPLSMPGVGASLILTFIRSMGFFITPALMGSPRDTMIAMSIQEHLDELWNWGFSSALSVILLIVVLVLIFIYNRFFGLDLLMGGKVKSRVTSSDTAHEEGMASRRGVIARIWEGLWNEERASGLDKLIWRLQDHLGELRDVIYRLDLKFIREVNWNRTAVTTICIFVFIFMILPVFTVIPMSFSNDVSLYFPPREWSLEVFKEFFLSETWMRSTGNSFRVAIQVMFLATFLGTLASLSLVRGNYRGKQYWYSLILSPIIIPVIVSAVSIYFFLAKLNLVGTITSLVLAHTVLAVPYVVIVMTSTRKGFDEGLEQASMSLGAGKVRTFFKITFPLIRPGVLTALLFAFIASFDELVGAMFICGVDAVTLPKQMWDGIRDEINPIIAVVATLLIFLTAFLMMSVVILRRRQERLYQIEAKGQ